MSLSDRPALCTFDQELRFLTVNDTMLWVLQKRREEVVGFGLLDLFPEATPLEELLRRAQRSLTVQKGRHFSPLIGRMVEYEIHQIGGVLQVGFSPGLD